MFTFILDDIEAQMLITILKMYKAESLGEKRLAIKMILNDLMKGVYTDVK